MKRTLILTTLLLALLIPCLGQTLRHPRQPSQFSLSHQGFLAYLGALHQGWKDHYLTVDDIKQALAAASPASDATLAMAAKQYRHRHDFDEMIALLSQKPKPGIEPEATFCLAESYCAASSDGYYEFCTQNGGGTLDSCGPLADAYYCRCICGSYIGGACF